MCLLLPFKTFLLIEDFQSYIYQRIKFLYVIIWPTTFWKIKWLILFLFIFFLQNKFVTKGKTSSKCLILFGVIFTDKRIDRNAEFPIHSLNLVLYLKLLFFISTTKRNLFKSGIFYYNYLFLFFICWDYVMVKINVFIFTSIPLFFFFYILIVCMDLSINSSLITLFKCVYLSWSFQLQVCLENFFKIKIKMLISIFF